MRIITLLLLLVLGSMSCSKKCGCEIPPMPEPYILAIQFVNDEGEVVNDTYGVLYKYQEDIEYPNKGILNNENGAAIVKLTGSDLFRKGVKRIYFYTTTNFLQDFSLSFDLTPTQTYVPDDIMGYKMVNIMLNDSIPLSNEDDYVLSRNIKINMEDLKLN